MKNQEISRILSEFAELYDTKDVPFKPRAFDRAAEGVAAFGRDIAEVYKKEGLKGLEEIPGVGRGIAERIEEYLMSGKIKEYDKLKKEFPVDIRELTAIEGIGPKLIKLLYEKLKVRNVADLEKAARAGKLKSLPRFGEKLEKKILKGLEFHKEGDGRFLLGEILPMAREIRERLLKISGVKKVELAGSLRRWQETVGDIDILAIASDAKKIAEYFSKMPEVSHVYGKGETKVMVRLHSPAGGSIDADLRILPPESFGAAMQYFTGNKDHNIEVRKIAIKKGYLLNEYGLYRGKKVIAAEREEEIYEKFGL
ncbi:MAG: nucleotidyltransferase domain-containing protein, partial [Patescibacteria group bacterium]